MVAVDQVAAAGFPERVHHAAGGAGLAETVLKEPASACAGAAELHLHDGAKPLLQEHLEQLRQNSAVEVVEEPLLALAILAWSRV